VSDATTYSISGIHHVQVAIPTGGEDEGRRFWGELLGLREVAKPAALAARGGCWFLGRDVEVHLGADASFSPARKAHPGILVTNLTALADRLTAAGTDVTWDDAFRGYRRFYVNDPFGNRLEFLEPTIA
jgi:catechol 2,3-dioxygenase-like lactoylglutathione lyase family enzyme